MEEGELSDSGSETGETEQHVAAGSLSAFIPVPRPSAPTPVEAFRKSQVPGLSSESEDSDSDIEDGGFIKRKCQSQEKQQGNFKNPLLQSRHRGPSDLGFADSQTKIKTKKGYMDLDGAKDGTASKQKRNVWGNVLAEQVITQEIGTFAVEKDLSALSYRDVEAYQIPRKSNITYDDDVFDISDDGDSKSPQPDKPAVEEEMETKDVEKEEKEAKDQEGLFEMETFGTITEKKLPKMTVKDRLGARRRASDSDSDSAEDHRFSRRNSNTKRKGENVDFQKELEKYTLKRKRVEQNSRKKNIKERLGRRDKPSESIPSDLMQVTENDSTEKIVGALTYNLKEPKVGLMTRVVEYLGPRKAVDLMSETITIESTGGLMVKDGSRRRTPGGVFLFLLREDRHIRKEDLDKIFEEEREHDKKHKRKILRAKRVQLAAIKRPQDLFTNKKNPKSSLSESKPGIESEPNKMGQCLEMEEGELDDDLDLDAEIGVQLE